MDDERRTLNKGRGFKKGEIDIVAIQNIACLTAGSVL